MDAATQMGRENDMQITILRMVLSAVIILAAGAAADSIKVGEPFPDLPLPDMVDGQPRSIADFRGQKVILHIFASW